MLVDPRVSGLPASSFAKEVLEVLVRELDRQTISNCKSASNVASLIVLLDLLVDGVALLPITIVAKGALYPGVTL